MNRVWFEIINFERQYSVLKYQLIYFIEKLNLC